MTDKKDLGGRPTLEQQAIRDHDRLQKRIDIATAKMGHKVLKHLEHMVENIDKYKDNIQLSVIDRVLKEHKEMMKRQEELKAPKELQEVVEEEDYSIGLSLTSTQTDEARASMN